MSRFKRSCAIIDSINEWVGQIFAWILVPMFLIATYEVISRYVFNSPTIWAWEINAWLMAIVTVMLGGYLLLHGSHVNVDVFTSSMSPRTRAMIDLFTSILFLFSIGLMLWLCTTQAWEAFSDREISGTIFKGPIYIVKMVFPLGCLLLLLQGIVKIIRDIDIVTNKTKESK